MIGKGWTWIGSDGAISTIFKRSQNLQRVMQGMVGFRPKAGSGELFQSIFKEWQRTDPEADNQVCVHVMLLKIIVCTVRFYGLTISV